MPMIAAGGPFLSAPLAATGPPSPPQDSPGKDRSGDQKEGKGEKEEKTGGGEFRSWEKVKTALTDTKDSLGKLFSVDPSFVIKQSAWFFHPTVSQYATADEQAWFKMAIPPFLRLVGTAFDLRKLQKSFSRPTKEGDPPADLMVKSIDMAHVLGDLVALAGYLMAYYVQGPIGTALIGIGYLSDLLSIAIHGRDYFVAKQEPGGGATEPLGEKAKMTRTLHRQPPPPPLPHPSMLLGGSADTPVVSTRASSSPPVVGKLVRDDEGTEGGAASQG